MEFLRQILQSEFGSFGFVAGLMGLGFWLTYWITKRVTEINSSHSEIKKNLDQQNGYIDEIRKDISYLKGSFETMRKERTPLTQSHSPISLTDEGKKVAKEIDADKLIKVNWDKIRRELDENIKEQNAYDIQQYCIETTSVEPEKMFDKDSLNKLKDFAYLKGDPLQSYLRMLGVLIRDIYMKEKGISLVEIDKHDPHK